MYHLHKYGSAKKYYQLAIDDKDAFKKENAIDGFNLSILRVEKETDVGMQKIDEHYRKE